MNDRPVEPFEVARMVEDYVTSAHHSATKYSNREPLDESDIYDLHALAGVERRKRTTENGETDE